MFWRHREPCRWLPRPPGLLQYRLMSRKKKFLLVGVWEVLLYVITYFIMTRSCKNFVLASQLPVHSLPLPNDKQQLCIWRQKAGRKKGRGNGVFNIYSYLNVTATLVFILQLSKMITQKIRTDGTSISQVLPLIRYRIYFCFHTNEK